MSPDHVDEAVWYLAMEFSKQRTNGQVYMDGTNNPLPTEQRRAQHFIEALPAPRWQTPTEGEIVSDPFTVEMGRRIRAARTAAGLTQAELADRTGMSRPNVTNIEAGGQELPAGRLVAVAAALGTTAGQLLGEQPAPSLPTVRIVTQCAVLCGQCGEVATGLSYPDARGARGDHVRDHMAGAA